MLREKDIERYFVEQVEKRGGKAYKWVSPGNRGVPDRIVMFPNRIITYFVELKAPGRKLSPQQKIQCNKLFGLSRPVYVIDTKEQVDIFIRNTN